MARQRARRSASAARDTSLLVVADPTEDLPFAKPEGQAIMLEAGERLVAPLIGRAATQTAVLAAAPSRTHLHFACHGHYDFANVFDSDLSLAPVEPNAWEDPLSLGEIVSLVDLGAAQLVVLSACETGMAEIAQAPDEQLGLASGFIEAGASGVVSTLWAVSDISTAVLMKRFYALHMSQGLHPAAALQQAQRWLRTSTTEELDLAGWWDEVAALTEDVQASVQASAQAAAHRATPGRRPFATPYHWAPFTFSGA
jgi:CHAT domain-containing protein